ncbi:hypothetical protein C5S31_03640 [ANME-1 cluster archaeon GoMg2]|nr:hypothetical protein [ANME-1 cluster archaeon GoMg2]
MIKKVAIFAFNGEPMCFAHTLLNTLDMKNKEYDVKLIIEGTATKQVKELADPKKPFANMYAAVKEAGLIDCVCKACSTQTGALESAEEQGLPICGEMSGHPSLSRYIEAGYEVMVF